MVDLLSTVQRPNPGETVSLFKFDGTSVGAQVLYFCQSSIEGEPVKFGGLEYTPADVEFTDLETTGQGTLPAPHIKVANANGVFQAIINVYGDLLGCTLQRVRTFRRYLDGQKDADPTAYFGPDTYRVERKVNENPVFIEWELSSAIDQEGMKLPGRQVIRDICLWRYRMWDAKREEFDYSKAQCPYTGNDYFAANGVSVGRPENDRCGRHLSDCEVRFGKNKPLPFGGFPGVARVRAL